MKYGIAEAFSRVIPIPPGTAFLVEGSQRAGWHAIRKWGRPGLEMGMMPAMDGMPGAPWQSRACPARNMRVGRHTHGADRSN